MTNLPIQELILWKQGIDYFRRRDTLAGQTVSLVVPRDATNAVLKSLTVIVYENGKVLSVDYETPEDTEQRLRDLSATLAERSSLIDLLMSLCGSHVNLALDNDQRSRGQLIGVEASLNDQPATVLLQSIDDDQLLRMFPLSRLQGVELQNQPEQEAI